MTATDLIKILVDETTFREQKKNRALATGQWAKALEYEAQVTLIDELRKKIETNEMKEKEPGR